MSQTTQFSTAPDDWFGQPRGLSVLFLTETWTQFSFFGMRALLVYYVTKELKIGQEDASLIYGGYAAAVYFTPIIGGVLADRFLGKTNAVILGGLMMAAGHFMMAFESLFYPALGAIAIGNGFFLPSLSGQVSQLYRENDPRLASAYNIYYVGINLGAFLAPIVCGWLGETYGWHWGFVAAGVGMLLALVIYLAGRRYLPQDSLMAEKAAEAVAPHGPERTQRFLLLAGIMLVVVIFRGAYEQNGNTIALWTDSGIDRHLTANVLIPLTWFQSINPLLIFLFTPVLVWHWTRQARRGREPSSITKMATGAGITAICYLVTAGAAAWSAASGVPASWPWVALYFLLLTLGELFILPVGLGLFGRAAPRGYGATAIAIWFFAGFAGNLFAGVLGMMWSEVPHAWFFVLIAAVAAVSGLMLLPFRAAVMQAEHFSASEAADTGAVAAPAA